MHLNNLLKDKKYTQNIDSRTWCTKNRVTHHGYLLTSCPGHLRKRICNNF